LDFILKLKRCTIFPFKFHSIFTTHTIHTTVDIVIKEEEKEGPLGKFLKIGKMTKTPYSSYGMILSFTANSNFNVQTRNFLTRSRTSAVVCMHFHRKCHPSYAHIIFQLSLAHLVKIAS
jgi:hypothetical protein